MVPECADAMIGLRMLREQHGWRLGLFYDPTGAYTTYPHRAHNVYSHTTGTVSTITGH